MTRIAGIIGSPLAHLACGAALAIVWLMFAAAHLVAFTLTGKASLLLFCIAETLVAGLLLIRTQPRSFTRRPHEWVIAIVGTALPLLFRPTATAGFSGADWGVMIGASIQIFGSLSLNRSFAIVPALREIKTSGMYRVVRHPIYASYVITFFSYLAANFSAHNLVVCGTSILLLLARVHFEERHLCAQAEYRAYRDRVRWRLIPFVY